MDRHRPRVSVHTRPAVLEPRWATPDILGVTGVFGPEEASKKPKSLFWRDWMEQSAWKTKGTHVCHADRAKTRPRHVAPQKTFKGDPLTGYGSHV